MYFGSECSSSSSTPLFTFCVYILTSSLNQERELCYDVHQQQPKFDRVENNRIYIVRFRPKTDQRLDEST